MSGTTETVTKTVSVAEFSRDAVKEISAAKGEPAWLLERRLAAFDAFEALPWPTGREEEWRRFDIASVRFADYTAHSYPGYHAATESELPAEVAAALGTDARSGAVVQHDSGVVFSQLEGSLREKGVLFSDLDTAVREHPELVKQHLGAIVPATETKFTAFNAAFWSGGTFVYVPANASVELPLRTIHWLGTNGLVMFNRTLIVVERGADVTYIDDYVSEQSTIGLENGVVELSVADGARLRYVGLQDWSESVTSFSHLRGKTGRDATINWLMIGLGSKASRIVLDAQLAAQGSSNELLGLYFGDKKQRFDYQTLQDHQAPHTTSDLLFKVVLKDSARSSYTGLIRVAPGAQRTDAYLANRNLLLSKKSRADSIPTLEIEANDVRCTHGATVGPVDEEQVFYLQARGIPRKDAERTIVEGFLEPLVARIPLESVRERIDRSISRKMG